MLEPRDAATAMVIRDEVVQLRDSQVWAAINELIEEKREQAESALHDPASTEAWIRYNQGYVAGLGVLTSVLDSIERQLSTKRRREE